MYNYETGHQDSGNAEAWNEVEKLGNEGPTENKSSAGKIPKKTSGEKAEEVARAREAVLDTFKSEEEQSALREEEKRIAEDLTMAHDILSKRKHERFQKQRVQEIIERQLNSRLLTVENLEDEVDAGSQEVKKRTISYNGDEIPVYDLKGIHFAMLSTTIDYKSTFLRPGIGAETYQTVMDNPEIWAERLDIAEKSDGFGTANINARGNTISASYRNSEYGLNNSAKGDLVYGFSKVEADSILLINKQDALSPNFVKKDYETKVNDPSAIEDLENNAAEFGYNEILLRRYSENGKAKRPDYIVVENGRIPEVALKHADFFGIPIVNIDRSSYAYEK